MFSMNASRFKLAVCHCHCEKTDSICQIGINIKKINLALEVGALATVSHSLCYMSDFFCHFADIIPTLRVVFRALTEGFSLLESELSILHVFENIIKIWLLKLKNYIMGVLESRKYVIICHTNVSLTCTESCRNLAVCDCL